MLEICSLGSLSRNCLELLMSQSQLIPVLVQIELQYLENYSFKTFKALLATNDICLVVVVHLLAPAINHFKIKQCVEITLLRSPFPIQLLLLPCNSLRLLFVCVTSVLHHFQFKSSFRFLHIYVFLHTTVAGDLNKMFALTQYTFLIS